MESRSLLSTWSLRYDLSSAALVVRSLRSAVPVWCVMLSVRMRVGHVEVNNEPQQAKLTGRPALSVFLAIRDQQMRRICDGDDPGCNGMSARSQSTDIPFQRPLAGVSGPDYRAPHLNTRRLCVAVWEMWDSVMYSFLDREEDRRTI